MLSLFNEENTFFQISKISKAKYVFSQSPAGIETSASCKVFEEAKEKENFGNIYKKDVTKLFQDILVALVMT